ncbi:hypothetical protein Tco_0037384 [Tanacetum coccineum]
MEAAVDQCSVDKKYFDIQKKELSLDNDRVLDHIICQDVMNIVMHVDSILANVLPIDDKYIVHIYENSLASRNGCREMQQVVLRCSRLENRNVNLELQLQHRKESFLNNRPLNNQNVPEIMDFFKVNEWQARLDAKDVSIANVRKHIESLKGNNVVEKDA